MTVLLPSRLGMPPPGIVPQFQIELDPRHPLTKHVAHFFVVSAVYPGGADLVTRQPATLAAGLTTTPASGFYSSANTERVFADPAKVALDSGTVILRYKEDGGGAGTDDCTFLFWKGPNKYMKRRSTNLIWEMDLGSAQWKPRPTINAFDGNWHDIGWRWDAAGLDNGKGVDLLIDAEIKSDGTTQTPSATTVTEVSLLSSYHGSIWDSVGGEVPYYIILDRPVSQGVLRALNADPFQLCRPAMPIPSFVPAGGTVITSSGAITLPAMTAAGSAEREVTTSGAVTLPVLTASGSAEREVTASGAVTLPVLTVAGSASVGSVVTSSGAIDLPALTAAGIAEREITSSGAITLALLAVAGSAEREVTASGAVTLAALTASGVAAVGNAITATGAISLPALTASGSAEREVTASGAVTLPAVVVTGTGERHIVGSGAITLPAAILAGAASRTITASGAITLPAILVSGYEDSDDSGVTITGAPVFVQLLGDPLGVTIVGDPTPDS